MKQTNETLAIYSETVCYEMFSHFPSTRTARNSLRMRYATVARRRHLLNLLPSEEVCRRYRKKKYERCSNEEGQCVADYKWMLTSKESSYHQNTSTLYTRVVYFLIFFLFYSSQMVYSKHTERVGIILSLKWTDKTIDRIRNEVELLWVDRSE